MSQTKDFQEIPFVRLIYCMNKGCKNRVMPYQIYCKSHSPKVCNDSSLEESDSTGQEGKAEKSIRAKQDGNKTLENVTASSRASNIAQEPSPFYNLNRCQCKDKFDCDCKCHSPKVPKDSSLQESDSKGQGEEDGFAISTSPSSFEIELFNKCFNEAWYDKKSFSDKIFDSMTEEKEICSRFFEVMLKYCLDKSIVERDYVKKASYDDLHSWNFIEKQKVKEIKKRIQDDCDFFIKNPQGMSLESALLTLKGNIQIEFEKELGL